MIRFYEPDVWNLSFSECNRSELLQFFLQNEYRDSIIIVSDQGGNFMGTATYYSVLHNTKLEDCIQKNKVILDDDIFLQAEKGLKEQEEVPVFNKQGDLIYFCYHDKRGMLNQTYANVIDYFEKNDRGLFIENIFETIQAIHFYDLNEWAYRIYKILEKRKIPTYVTGQKWEELFHIKQTTNITFPEYSVMSIYSEGTSIIKSKGKSDVWPCTIFYFLEKIAMANQLEIATNFRKNLIAPMYICRFPEFEELKYYTANESLRNTKKIHTGILDLNMNSFLIKSAFENATEIPYKQFYKQRQIGIEEAQKIYFDFEGRNICGYKWGYGKNRIYLIGPCIVDIHCTLKDDTLMAYLQQHLELLKHSYEIVSIAIFYMEIELFDKLLESLSFNKNDIVIYFNCVGQDILKNNLFRTSTDIDLLPLFNNRMLTEEWFFDIPIHTTKYANRKIAEILYQTIEQKVTQLNYNELQENTNLSIEDIPKELKNYLTHISENKLDSSIKIGSIVMNCNPFTLGHQHLINTARKQVDYLYVFIVEEDRSFFKFKDRFQLVKDCCIDFENVKILPSSKYVLSYETFPLYFQKDIHQEAVIDASLDLSIFGRYIAPALHITVRFVGEEPNDNITHQYNLEMIKNLPFYGIEVKEIPRIEMSGEPISASKVRKLLKLKKFNEIKKLVPQATYDFIIREYS